MIAIDIEASGVNYDKHSIISIGAVDMIDPQKRFYGECRVWDGSHFSQDTANFLQMTEEQFNDPKKQTEGELVEKFMRWTESVEDRTLLGQNVSFDRDFLKVALGRIHHEWSLAYRTVDTHSLAVMHHVKRGLPMPIENHRSALDLDTILNYVGIPEEPVPHNALTGALSHAEVANRLLYDKKFLPEFNQFEIPWVASRG